MIPEQITICTCIGIVRHNLGRTIGATIYKLTWFQIALHLHRIIQAEQPPVNMVFLPQDLVLRKRIPNVKITKIIIILEA